MPAAVLAMPAQSPAERFAELQRKAQEAYTHMYAFRQELNRRYQDHAYAPAAKRNRLAVLERAERRAWDRFWKYLCVISTRAWEAGVPVSWIREALTYDDAVTTSALSVIPPPAYGYTVEESRRFAWPVQAARQEVSTHGA